MPEPTEEEKKLQEEEAAAAKLKEETVVDPAALKAEVASLKGEMEELKKTNKALSLSELEEMFKEEEPPAPEPAKEEKPFDFETAKMGEVAQKIYDDVKKSYVDPLVKQVSTITAKLEISEATSKYGKDFLDNKESIARVGMQNPHLTLEQCYLQFRGANPAKPEPEKPEEKPGGLKKPTPLSMLEQTSHSAVKPKELTELSGAAEAAFDEVFGAE